MPAIRSFLVCLVLYALSGPLSPSSALETIDRADFDEPVPLAPGDGFIDGVWASRGYGWVLEVGNGSVTRYEIGRDYCYRLPEAARGVTDMLSLPFRFYRRLPGEDIVSFQYLADDAGPVFDRLEALPARCREGQPATAQASLNVMLDLFETHYAHFERRGASWPELKAAALAAYRADPGETGLKAAAEAILMPLGDSHSKLFALIDGEPQRIQYGLGETLTRIRGEGSEYEWLTGIFDTLKSGILDDGGHHVANDRLLWGTIGGRVGYIQIFVMGGFTDTDISEPSWGAAEIAAFDAVMDEAKAAFAGMDAVIIDLSNNRGGYDKVARRVAEHFIAEPVMAYTTVTPGTGVSPNIRMLHPAGEVRYQGRLILMTSDVTVSGGELATLSLRQVPGLVHVGTSTRGAFSTPLAKGLPNGWVVELSNEIYAAPDGTIYEGSGIPPAIRMEIYERDDPVASHAAAVRRLSADPARVE